MINDKDLNSNERTAQAFELGMDERNNFQFIWGSENCSLEAFSGRAVKIWVGPKKD